MIRPKIVFMGTPEIVMPTLNFLYKFEKVDLIQVISQPSRPVGRKQIITDPPPIEFAKKHNIPFRQSNNINKAEEVIQEWRTTLKPDLIIVFAFAQFISKTILNLPTIGCFNIHTSLLPSYRGAAPIHYALLNGDSVTGITLQRMVKKMDAGDVACTEKIGITDNMTYLDLERKLSLVAPNILCDFLEKVIMGKQTFSPQEGTITFAPTIKKEEGRINFVNETAREILNKWRAFVKWPSTYFLMNGKKTIIESLKISNNAQNIAPNCMRIENKQLFIGCKEGVLEILKIKVEGKKSQDIHSFINGIQNIDKLTLG